MKREELDKLRKKYFAGETTIEEERRLKEVDGEEFFSLLKGYEEKMEWDFGTFIASTDSNSQPTAVKVISLKRKLILIGSIAASLAAVFLYVPPWLSKDKGKYSETKIAYHQNPSKVEPSNVTSNPVDAKVAIPVKSVVSNQQKHRATLKSSKHGIDGQYAFNIEEDEPYVEINGVRIYNEEKALEVTETAVQLATSNLKKGMEGVGHIKYLKIEI